MMKIDEIDVEVFCKIETLGWATKLRSQYQILFTTQCLKQLQFQISVEAKL